MTEVTNGVKGRRTGGQGPDGAGPGPPETHILKARQRVPTCLKIMFKPSDGAMPGS